MLPDDSLMRQSPAWGAVVFYCALFRSLSSLRQIEGELLNGETWYPGINVPGQSYRFRFRHTVPDGAGEGLCTMLGMRLLPGEVIQWLSKTPQALDTLLSFLRGDFGNASVIYQIVENAIEHAGGNPREARSEPSAVAAQVSSAPAMTAAGDTVDNPEMALAPSEALSGEPTLSPGAEPLEPPPLTSALNENTPLTIPDARAGQEGNDPAIQDVISLMGFDSPPQTGEREPDQKTPAVRETDTRPGTSEGPGSLPCSVTEINAGAEVDICGDYGQAFLSWLRENIISGGLSVNTREAQVHIVGGLVFLPAPGIFFSFIKDRAYQPSLKNDIQRGFECLGLHFTQKGKGVFSCLRYEDENRKGRYEKLSGYLIRSKIIYGAQGIPDERV